VETSFIRIGDPDRLDCTIINLEQINFVRRNEEATLVIHLKTGHKVLVDGMVGDEAIKLLERRCINP
jgi:hypothetical protein